MLSDFDWIVGVRWNQIDHGKLISHSRRESDRRQNTRRVEQFKLRVNSNPLRSLRDSWPIAGFGMLGSNNPVDQRRFADVRQSDNTNAHRSWQETFADKSFLTFFGRCNRS